MHLILIISLSNNFEFIFQFRILVNTRCCLQKKHYDDTNNIFSLQNVTEETEPVKIKSLSIIELEH